MTPPSASEALARENVRVSVMEMPDFSVVEETSVKPAWWERWGIPDTPAGLFARRALIGIFGGTVLLMGIIMIVTPGPAIVFIPIGLSILALEFAFARFLLDKLSSFFSKMKAKRQARIDRRRARREARRAARQRAV